MGPYYFIHSYDEKEIPLFLILSSYLSPNVTYTIHVCEHKLYLFWWLQEYRNRWEIFFFFLRHEFRLY